MAWAYHSRAFSASQRPKKETQKTTFWLPDGKAGADGDVVLLKFKAPLSLSLQCISYNNNNEHI